jgi:selenocysteine lyase/cysteine desulfurase
MPVSRRWAYFDHAAVAPIPRAAARAMRQYAVEACREGDTRWLTWHGQTEQLRTHLAALVGAMPEEIALVPNTTIGLGLIAEGWRWRPGDSLVVPANEFPSNLVPWRNLARRGVEIREVPVDDSGEICLARILQAIDSTTQLVALSWVGFASGWRIQLAEICQAIHNRGPLVVVDAIQGLGAFPIDVTQSHIDFLVADGHKWLLGPEGAGLMFIRASHQERLDPLMIGWHSLEPSLAFEPSGQRMKSTAECWEGGSANTAGLIGLEQSVQLLLELGANQPESRIAAAIIENVAQVEDKLLSAGFAVHLPRTVQHRSGIVGVSLPSVSPTQLRQACWRQGIVTSVRGGRLRVSTHAYNNSEDIDRLVQALQDFQRE